MKIEEVFNLIREQKIPEGSKFRNGIDNRIIVYTGLNLIIEENRCNIFSHYNLNCILEFDLFKVYGVNSGKLELRGNSTMLDHSCEVEKGDTLEIVLWKGSSCITIGYWIEEELGFNFKFVHNRFMTEDIDKEDLATLISEGQRILDVKYKELVKDNLDYIRELRGDNYGM